MKMMPYWLSHVATICNHTKKSVSVFHAFNVTFSLWGFHSNGLIKLLIRFLCIRLILIVINWICCSKVNWFTHYETIWFSYYETAIRCCVSIVIYFYHNNYIFNWLLNVYNLRISWLIRCLKYVIHCVVRNCLLGSRFSICVYTLSNGKVTQFRTWTCWLRGSYINILITILDNYIPCVIL